MLLALWLYAIWPKEELTQIRRDKNLQLRLLLTLVTDAGWRQCAVVVKCQYSNWVTSAFSGNSDLYADVRLASCDRGITVTKCFF